MRRTDLEGHQVLAEIVKTTSMKKESTRALYTENKTLLET